MLEFFLSWPVKGLNAVYWKPNASHLRGGVKALFPFIGEALKSVREEVDFEQEMNMDRIKNEADHLSKMFFYKIWRGNTSRLSTNLHGFRI